MKNLFAALFAVGLLISSQSFAECAFDGGGFVSELGGCHNTNLGGGDLVWSIDSAAATNSTSNYASAVTYCSNLGAGWRLPTKVEMEIAASQNAADYLDYAYGANLGRWTSTFGTGKNRKLVYLVAIGDGGSFLASQTSSAFLFCVKPAN